MSDNIDELSEKLDICISRLDDISRSLVLIRRVDLKLFDWFDEWLEVYKMPNVTKNALRKIEITVRLHIKSNIENKRLIDVTERDIILCLSKIGELSTRNAESCHNTFTDSFHRAYVLKYIPRDIMIGVDKPKHVRKADRALTEQEIKKLMTTAKNFSHWEIFYFYIYTGVRREEALNLKWSDIDFEKKFVHVPGTKSENADRIFPLYSIVEDLLRQLPKTAERVFGISCSTLIRTYEKLKEASGVEFTIKRLRHTFITRAYENGIDRKTLSQFVGHATMNFTAQNYVHLRTSFIEAETAKLNDILKGINTS